MSARRAARAARSWAGRTARSVKYRGHQVGCPVCGGTYSQFIRYNTRPHAQCPRCLSLERHRTIWLALHESGVLTRADARVLDIAPRSAMSARLRRSLGHRYVSGDLLLPPAHVYLDLQRLPFADSVFHVVICSMVLEHVPDDASSMAEIRRVLAPDGSAYLAVPIHPTATTTDEDPGTTDPQERIRRFGQADHVRYYARADFERRLGDAGLAAARPALQQLAGARSPEYFGLDPDVYVASRELAVHERGERSVPS